MTHLPEHEMITIYGHEAYNQTGGIFLRVEMEQFFFRSTETIQL